LTCHCADPSAIGVLAVTHVHTFGHGLNTLVAARMTRPAMTKITAYPLGVPPPPATLTR
jgi:hypothetical protein